MSNPTEGLPDEVNEHERERENDVITRPLAPESLVGSWFVKINEDDLLVEQGCVVAEPQAGCYLLELHNWIDGGATAQRLATIDEVVTDGQWRFFDNDRWMREFIVEYGKDRETAT